MVLHKRTNYILSCQSCISLSLEILGSVLQIIPHLVLWKIKAPRTWDLIAGQIIVTFLLLLVMIANCRNLCNMFKDKNSCNMESDWLGDCQLIL